MAAQKDYYELLGVSRDASADEIRKAYLKLAHKYHPDKTGGDKVAEEKLKQVNQAYDVLKNPEKRSQYDRFGSYGEQFGGPGAGFSGFGFGGGESPFDDFFDVLFGRGGGTGRRRPAQPGSDIEYRIPISLKEAAFGTKKRIRLTRKEICGDCGGTGAAKGSRPQNCNVCGGTGQIRRAEGFFSISQTCPRCRGAGQIVSEPCRGCSGAGRKPAKRELSIDIPPGVDTGTRLRMSGEGEPGDSNAPRGDLYIAIEVEPHEIFSRKGNDIICEFPISFPQASLGTTVQVPTLEGERDLKIPAGTQSGALLRLRGMGTPDLRGYRRGDQIVCIHVETPTRLSREQKDLLKRLQELSNDKSHPLHETFMDKLRKTLGK